MQAQRLALFVAAVIAAGAVCGGAIAAPVTLAAPARGRILALTQDGGRIAWIGYRERVYVKTLSTGRTAILGRAHSGGGAGGYPTGIRNYLLALAGKRALWTFQDGGNCIETSMYTATVGEGKPPAFVSIYLTFCSYEGWLPTASAGDGATLAVTAVGFERSADCYSRVALGSTARIVGTSTLTVDGVPPAVQLAVSAGRVAVVPADSSCEYKLAPAPNGTVEIRDASGGAVLAAFAPVGTVQALALSGSRAVVLVKAADGSKRVERYDAATGALLGATQVSRYAASVLDMGGGWIVYRTGRAIRLIDAVTGAKRLLATARAIPLGLSIESRRVAWAENHLGHGKVRSVLAPLHDRVLARRYIRATPHER